LIRKKIIAGNWKMNKTLPEAQALTKELLKKIDFFKEVDVVLCPPYPCLSTVDEMIRSSPLRLGAQDAHWEDAGAYTGKVSAAMLKSVNVSYVILGHSEQRIYFNETNETVNKKVKKMLATELIPIICVGESLQERNSGQTQIVVKNHLLGALRDIPPAQAVSCVIAYEPVWAIGTGINATPTQANEVHQYIRKLLSELYNATTAEKIRIQYGGSLKPDNATALLNQSNIDGGLIGGASLEAESFLKIIRYNHH